MRNRPRVSSTCACNDSGVTVMGDRSPVDKFGCAIHNHENRDWDEDQRQRSEREPQSAVSRGASSWLYNLNSIHSTCPRSAGW